MVWTKTFGLKFKTFSSQVTRIWGMRMEVWLWCRCECWVWWMAQVSANVMEIQQWEYEQQISRECFILILSRSLLWSDCWTTIGHFLSGERGAVSSVQSPPGASQSLAAFSRDQINSKMRQRRHLQSKAMGRQIWNWTEECLWAACLRKQLLS